MSANVSRLAAQGGTIVSHAPARAHWLVRLARDVVLLGAPVAMAVLTLVLAWQFRVTPLAIFDGVLSPRGVPELYPSAWLTVGHAIVPVVFLIANLVNRRLGDDYAIAHVLASWVLVAVAAAVLIAPADAPSVRVAVAFLGAMALGQLAGTFVFDRTRGVVWWKAPLYSALTSSFVAMFLFYPFAFLGGDWIWLYRMSVDAGTKAAMSFLLLVPYYVLRPIVRPGGGLGGF
jgi:uncharacterized PurR-regulated membrane protein YhhQ (DUF165 family)